MVQAPLLLALPANRVEVQSALMKWKREPAVGTRVPARWEGWGGGGGGGHH